MKRQKNRFSRLLGISAALLLTGASVAVAATPADNILQRKLTALYGPTKTLTNANVDEIHAAALKALAEVVDADGVLPSAIVTASVARVPQFSQDIAAAALARVYAETTPTLSKLSKLTGKNNKATDAARAKEVTSVAKTSFTKAFANYPKKNGNFVLPNGNTYLGTANKADVAASLTLAAVEKLRGQAKLDGTTLLSPLQVYVTNAVKVAAKSALGQRNGAAGLVNGAVSELAGRDNDNIANLTGDNDATGKSNKLVTVVIATAVKNAPKNVLDIAQAAGYAFANTYLQTHSGPNAPTSGTAFVSKNTAGLVAAVKAGMVAANAAKLGFQIEEQVNSGIAKAYLGLANAGSGGVIFTNGEASANALSSTN